MIVVSSQFTSQYIGLATLTRQESTGYIYLANGCLGTLKRETPVHLTLIHLTEKPEVPKSKLLEQPHLSPLLPFGTKCDPRSLSLWQQRGLRNQEIVPLLHHTWYRKVGLR